MAKVSIDKVLSKLPESKDQWIKVVDDQNVNDIIERVLIAHDRNAPLYDQFAILFDAQSINKICDNLYYFCKENIEYREESKNKQTTAVPNGFLSRGYGDCKHYSSFVGGCLASIARQTGKKIDWCYRFVSYDEDIKTPYHVFVVVNPDENEIWIDAVPGANNMQPVYQLDRKPKSNSMALYDQVGSINNGNQSESVGRPSLRNFSNKKLNDYGRSGNNRAADNGAAIGWSVETSYGYSSGGKSITPVIGHSFYGSDWLGLSRYGNYSGTDLTALRISMQALIDKGPSPWKMNDNGLLEKVLRDNVQYWNFYYPNGTSPVPRQWEQVPELKNYLMITLTPDGRLTFDRNEEPPHDWQFIHYLTDWTNFYVQKFSDKPYIVLIDHMKRLGKGWNTPQEGSLWYVIHTGDVHFATVFNLMGKIPGLDAFLSQFGVNLATLKAYASKFMGVSGNNPLPGGGSNPLPGGYNPGGYLPGGNNPNLQPGQNDMLISAVAALATYYFTRNITYTAAVGIGSYFIMQKQQQQTAQLPLPKNQNQLPGF